MMREAFITESNCITPIGFDVAANVKNIGACVSGIQLHQNSSLMMAPFYASIINDIDLDTAFAKISPAVNYTKLEKMMILALYPIAEKSKLDFNDRTAFILSTTKGNITALKNKSGENFQKAQLPHLAKKVADFFKFKTEPIVISNACVSGIMAVSVAKRLIQSKIYDNIFIVAGDEVSEFVLSGF